jgi:hypothetical protein
MPLIFTGNVGGRNIIPIPEGDYWFTLYISFIPNLKIPMAKVKVEVERINEDGIIEAKAEARPVKGIYAITGHKRIWYISRVKQVGDRFITLYVDSGEERRKKIHQRRRSFGENEMKEDWFAFALNILSEEEREKLIEFEENKLLVTKEEGTVKVLPVDVKNPRVFSELIITVDENRPVEWVARRVMGVADIYIIASRFPAKEQQNP